MQKATSHSEVRWEVRDPSAGVTTYHTTHSLSTGLSGRFHHYMQARLYCWQHKFALVRRIKNDQNSSGVSFI